MNDARPFDEPLLVACLCAAWCHICADYRATFVTLASEFAERACFVWVDIEDEDEALGGVDIVDFPTLLLASRDEVRFFGAVTAQAQTARQLVHRALQGRLGALADTALADLAARVRALRGCEEIVASSPERKEPRE